MEPSTSQPSSPVIIPNPTRAQLPKPERSPVPIHLPKAPPSYYDFPPSYTTSSDSITDELPAYYPSDATQQGCRIQVDRDHGRVYTVMPRQAYAIQMSRHLRHTSRAPDQTLRRRLHLLVGTFFVLMLASIILSLGIVMAVYLV